MWPAIIAGAASLIGSHQSSSAQQGANRMNLAIWREQRDFMEKQSNTEIRRRVEDMRAAGINPMLSVMGGGAASSPNVQPPQVRSTGEHVQRGWESVASSAISAMQLKLLGAQARSVSADAQLKEAQVPWAAQNAQLTSENLFSEMKILATRVGQAGIERDLKKLDLEQLQPLVVKYQSLMNQAIANGLPASQAEAEFFRTVPQAKWVAIIRSVLGVSGDNLLKR